MHPDGSHENGAKGFDSKTVQRSALCRSRRELSNEYLLAKIGVDTAENEPLEVWGKIQFTIHFTPYLGQLRLPVEFELEPFPGGLRADERRGVTNFAILKILLAANMVPIEQMQRHVLT